MPKKTMTDLDIPGSFDAIGLAIRKIQAAIVFSSEHQEWGIRAGHRSSHLTAVTLEQQISPTIYIMQYNSS
ncbi:hypothetical protein VTN77DRAFT_2940 [Rasamsonia byssochlamydoides]|uniref:uncharacterized protein n=1 Tax=Rasamsonia byssochlamydoides TaxID=89139 RepID=UPI0037420115